MRAELGKLAKTKVNDPRFDPHWNIYALIVDGTFWLKHTRLAPLGSHGQYLVTKEIAWMYLGLKQLLWNFQMQF